nr:PepSY domain-containing protein [Saprospiraceae bacterium]
MTKYWRRVHQLCTVFVGLFILLASVTGIVLAIEPLVLSKNSVSRAITEDLTYVQFVDQLQDQFIEIFSIEIDPYQNIKVQGISESNDDIVYINAQTLKAVVPPQQFNDIFQFSRDLHRSLFLKTPGRILMGLAALGLLILVISGIGLQIRRAGGLNNIF